jgi:parallel beta-helix repeat protein
MLLLVLAQPLQGPYEVNASDTIYVPGDFLTIQEAIDNASDGDTIIVSSNTYQENIIVNKRLTLQGAGKETTFIDGTQSGNAVKIHSDDVEVSGFTVFNSQFDGFDVDDVNNTHIHDCDIYNCDVGIGILRSNHTWIENCRIYDTENNGVFLTSSRNFLIQGCEIFNATIYSYLFPLELRNSHFGTIVDCNIYNNIRGGSLSSSNENRIENCNFFNNFNGLVCEDSNGVLIFDCSFYNNTIDGLYLGGSDNLRIIECHSYYNRDGFEMEGCDNVLLAKNQLHNNSEQGIELSWSDFVDVVDCEVYWNDDHGIQNYESEALLIQDTIIHSNKNGVQLSGSDFVSICNSSIYDNRQYGVFGYSCLGAYVRNSKIFGNVWDGIELSVSTFSFISSNFTDNVEKGCEIIQSNGRMNYCNIHDNDDWGSRSENSIVQAKYNWWGNETGPYHDTLNPTGTGDDVSPEFTDFDPWLLEPYTPTILISDLRCQLRQLNWSAIYPDQVTPKPLGCSAAWTSDWLASAFVTTKLPNLVEGLDTDSSFVDQVTGKAVGAPGTPILTFAGPFVNPIVKRAENSSTPDVDRAPVKFHSESGFFYFQLKDGTSIPNASLPVSVINKDQDLFVIERYVDGDGRLMMICYGFGWPGTYAAGKYFDKIVFPRLETFPHEWIIVKWEDTNGDGFVNNPGEGDTYNLIATGNLP